MSNLVALSVTVDLWAMVSALVVLAAGIAWLVNLETRDKSRGRDVRDLVKVGDERHQENLQRFAGIAAGQTRQDDKLDRLLERMR